MTKYTIYTKKGNKIQVHLTPDYVSNDDFEEKICGYRFVVNYPITQKVLNSDPYLPQDIRKIKNNDYKGNYKILYKHSQGYVEIPLASFLFGREEKLSSEKSNPIKEIKIVDTNTLSGSQISQFSFPLNKHINIDGITINQNTSQMVLTNSHLKLKLPHPSQVNQYAEGPYDLDLKMSIVRENGKKTTHTLPVKLQTYTNVNTWDK